MVCLWWFVGFLQWIFYIKKCKYAKFFIYVIKFIFFNASVLSILKFIII